MWNGLKKYIYNLASGSDNSSVLCHNIVQGNLGRLDLPQNMTLISYIDGLVLISWEEEECLRTQPVPSTAVNHVLSEKQGRGGQST